ncbi:MAG: DNA repair protein, partial [candidate division Zixibacteria bacterium]|nr:DNA repair protein [candidate division Zixibacteria bacterium]
FKKHKVKITGTADIVPIMWEILFRENKRERSKDHFWCVGLANDNRILYIELVALGTVNCAKVNPSDVLELASIKLAVKLILVHNHPSEALIPSAADKDMTDELIQAAKLLHKEILDHIIISTTDYYSFVGNNLLEILKQSLKYVLPYELKAKGKKEGKKEGVIEGEVIGIEKGETIGRKKEKEEMAKSLIQQKVEISIIAKVSGLSIEAIKQL